MTQPYHVLNGDALKEQFPTDLAGEIIVARECLVDGPVQHRTLLDFFRTRAAFLAEAYGDLSWEAYQQGSAREFEKITQIPADSTVYLWFEDDLFCQVNCWFVVHLLHQFVTRPSVHLVRPPKHSPYGFGRYDTEQLRELSTQGIPVTDTARWSRLWEHYHRDELASLLRLAREMADTYPFLLPAAEAHRDRQPTDHGPGRPTEILRTIMEETGTSEFGPVFREFHQRAPIYGFGDLQVKRLFDELLSTEEWS
ncbi:DUF1835 domain-containing protein [Lewinella sp. W8]|uniref:DUF1835 domain-containing protein n=1 Tax=Lewinella sp. W8 TaxID=2528208 RepID=UPI001068B59A|nr:DUF1835 domain-containing protein [Lewinella sp. W8]MTB51131.1 DUF1835 domain-containing protein [Lewinella sp. W8]